jgi:hypothetical protein
MQEALEQQIAERIAAKVTEMAQEEQNLSLNKVKIHLLC